MIKKGLFKKPANELEGHSKSKKAALNSESRALTCPGCHKTIYSNQLFSNYKVCPHCSYHFRINARQRISIICDEDSFVEIDCDVVVKNPIKFPKYEEKINSARLESTEKEAVICGSAKINGVECAMFVMEPFFMMGSMGSVVGEKITRLFELAIEKKIPVIGFTVSGGARMQEGIISLMQMAKTSGAVKRHSDAGLLYITVITDPTTGGVTASFAMEGDIIIAEPKSLIAFAGPRVIEQTIRKKLPEGFQKAEFLLEKGFIDDIVDRKNLKNYLSKVLKIHA